MRWVFAYAQQFHGQSVAAASLPAPQAIKKLADLKSKIVAFQEKSKSPATPFSFINPETFIAMHRSDRRIKMLQTIEALRDYASHHENGLPNSLAEMDLPIPVDPMTGEPFVYELVAAQEGQAATAKLSYPTIPGVDDKTNNRLPSYQIQIVR